MSGDVQHVFIRSTLLALLLASDNVEGEKYRAALETQTALLSSCIRVCDIDCDSYSWPNFLGADERS
jgi:hypothetical protein